MRGYIIVLTILMFAGTVSADTLHVPANYTSIQGAIDSAESGDNIHVSKKVYCECIIIDKPLTLLGDHAMILGSEGRDVVTVGADGVTVSGFMIEGGMVGINIFASSESIIENNRINNNIYGINMLDADNSIIMDNMIMNNHGHGISMQNASKNIIVENLILCNSGDGIWMEQSTGNVIQADVIENVSISHSNDIIIDANMSPVIEHITIVAPTGIVVSTECMPDNTTGNMVDNTTDQTMGVCANGDEILYVPTDYPTIQSAIGAATNGDTIYVYNGTYMENLVVDKEVTLQGEDRSNTVIDGNGGNVVSIKSPYVSINGFTIRNGGYGIYMAVGRDCKITDCDIHSNIHGIYFWRACRDNIISDCILHSNTNNGIFIFMSSSNNSITGCTAYLNGNNGIMLQKACSNNTVVNCDASLNQQNGICVFQVCTGNTIRDCTAHSNNGSGIAIQKVCSNNTVENCSANLNQQNGICIFQVCTENAIRDCSAHSNNRSGILIQKICAGNTVVGCDTNSNLQNGICVFQVCGNNTVTDCSAAQNTVNGIFVSHACSGNAVTDCNSSESVNGIHVSHASAANMVIGCDTPGNINGIFISHASTENTIQDCDTGSNVRRGIFITMSSKENKIINCVFGSAPYDVVLSRSSTGNTITGSTVGTTSPSDLMVEYASSGTVIETTFDTAGVSLASMLTVKNYLDVLVLNGTGTNPPIQGADVSVTDEGQAIYASSGYGGTDSATDHAGRCDHDPP